MTEVGSFNIASIKAELLVHKLEWDFDRVTTEGHGVLWENGFNKTHRAEIFCFNSGAVVGKSWDTEQPDNIKVWLVKDLSDNITLSTFTKPLLLTLDETIEYVRHWIWANHNV
jgi:hypothetical protein